jgi:methylenetetrahydrofolate dehydrogenase (NADP+) / methenyltetrahydrofolate cyclohydrolase
LPAAWAFFCENEPRRPFAFFRMVSFSRCFFHSNRLNLSTKGSLEMAVELRGKAVADELSQQILEEVRMYKRHGILPKMATLIVDGDPASLIYAKRKQRMAEKLGIAYDLIQFPASVSEQELIGTIERLNQDATVHGIMLELPLPRHITTDRVIATVSPQKDVDGLTPFNRTVTMDKRDSLYPATPLACVRLLKHYGYELSGKHVVLVGCGKTVGLPLMHLLIQENATVTACHAGTIDLKRHIMRADIVFVAVGKRNLITPDMVHPNLLIIDAGINETPDKKIVGDVSPEVMEYVKAMSPTPGGVGAVTTVQLFANLMTAMKLQNLFPHGTDAIETAELVASACR